MRVPGFKSGRLMLLFPAAALVVAVLPLSYTVTVGDPDLARMVYALVRGSVSGQGTAAGEHYGLPFSFGYYKSLYALAPHPLLRDPDTAARLMNSIGFSSAMLLVLLMTLYVARFWGDRVAICAGLVAGFSPVFLMLAMSGHPVLPATAAAFAGGLLLAAAEEKETHLQSAVLYLAAWLILVVALTLRAEVVLIFLFLLIGRGLEATFSRPRLRRFALRGAILASAFLAFLALQRPYLQIAGTAGDDLASFLRSFWRLELVTRGIGVFVIATGAVSCAGLIVLAWLNRRTLRASRSALAAAAALMLPTLLF